MFASAVLIYKYFICTINDYFIEIVKPTAQYVCRIAGATHSHLHTYIPSAFSSFP